MICKDQSLDSAQGAVWLDHSWRKQGDSSNVLNGNRNPGVIKSEVCTYLQHNMRPRNYLEYTMLI